MDSAGKAAGGRFSSSFKNALKMGTAIAGAAVAAGGAAFLKSAVGEAREAAKIGALTEQVIKSTGGAAQISAKQVSSLAEAISRKSGIDDEAIQSASNLLLTFTNVRNEVGKGNDVFNQATQIATDMGVALGNEPKSAAIQLGKALNDPVKGITALTRVGVSFTEQQKEQIAGFVKSGDTMKAQKVILGELNKEFGGAAKAAATPADRARVAWGNFKEEAGTAILPMLDRLATWFTDDGLPAVTRFGHFIKSDVVPPVSDLARWIRRNQEWLVPLVGGIAGGIAVFKTVAAATRIWAVAQGLLNAALLANPIGLVVAALAGLAVGLTIAWKKSETFRRVTTAVWETVKDKTQLGALWVADKVLWMAEKMLGAMSKAFSWVPGLGDKMKRAYAAIKGFREAVNREMDQIQDENVNVTFAVGRRKHQESTNSGFGPQISGGAGPLPRRFLAAAGGAGGLTFRTKTDMAGVRGVASAARSQAAAIADELRAQARAEARRRAAAANASGPSGKAGRVLPAGAYSIGMPYHGYAGHNGADYPAPTGTPVSSPWAGRVVASLDLPGSNPYNSTPFRSYGRYIKIQHANGLSTLYAHLSARGVSAGQAVKAGQFIGRVGMNGNATGPHLHFEAARNGSTFNPASLGIFDRGGIMRGLGINLSGQPERVLSPRQTALHDRQTAALEAIAARGSGSNRVRLVVRDREFDAYIEDVADDRVRTHKRHRDQLDRMGR
jgi:murein DD-endopeptidase MepM/ murein hydrolase activator NlpD